MFHAMVVPQFVVHVKEALFFVLLLAVVFVTMSVGPAHFGRENESLV